MSLRPYLLLAALCWAGLLQGQESGVFWKQHPAIRGFLRTKEWQLSGPVRSVTECSHNYTGEDRQKSDKASCIRLRFDKEKRLTEKIVYDKGDREEGRLTERYHYSGDRPDSITGSRRSLYRYDRQGLLSSIDHYEEDSRKMGRRNIFSYGAGGMIMSEKELDLPGEPGTVTRFTYDDKGDFRTWQSGTTLFTYATAPDGAALTTVEDVQNPAANSVTSSYMNGKLHVVRLVSRYGHAETVTTYQYEYDAQGNWIRQERYIDGKPFSVSTRTIVYYGDQEQEPAAAEATGEPAAGRQPEQVLREFFEALGRQDFDKAYRLCAGRRWGTPEQFAGTKMYGGISRVTIRSIRQKGRATGDSALVEAVTDIDDPVNGNGSYAQDFTLKKMEGRWKITGIKLLSNSRGTDNRNLKIGAQPDFSLAQAEQLTQHLYDTMRNEPMTEEAGDTMSRSFGALRFFKSGSALYAVAVCENRGPFYGVSTGWCDVFAFTKKGGEWVMTDYMLHAGGGGMYGSPGSMKDLLRVGSEAVGIVLRGGQTHMGTYFYEDIIALENGKLRRLVSVTTEHSYEGDHLNICERNEYSFRQNGKAMYDLMIIRYDCKKGDRKKDEALVPYEGKDGYRIPDRFVFST